LERDDVRLGEVKKPHRNIPIALISGMTICMALYVFVNATYFYVLTPTDVASVPATSSVRRSLVNGSSGQLP